MKLKTAMIAGGGLIGVLLVGWAGLTAFVIWANLYQAEKQGRLFYLPTFALTTDRTPVEFTMRGYVFRIPKAYLEFTHQWEGGQAQEIFLQALLLPELEPPSEHNLEDFKKTGWVDEMGISIKNAENIAMDSVDSYYLGEIKPGTRTQFNDDLFRYDLRGNRGDQLYVPSEPHPHLRYFTCAIEERSVVSPSCEASFHLNDELYIRYIYSARHLEKWREIHSRVVLLINGFVLERPD